MFVRKVKIVTYGYHWSLILDVKAYFMGRMTAHKRKEKSSLWEIPPRATLEVDVNAPADMLDITLSGPADLYVYGMLGRIYRLVGEGGAPGTYHTRVNVLLLL